MNIFYLASDPVQCAQWMVDSHVVKMILESAQILSTAHRVLDGELVNEKTEAGRNIKRYRLNDYRESLFYKSTHVNHPSNVWCRQSVENYNWLVDHLFALMEEYTHRYGKIHKVRESGLGYYLQSPPNNLKEWDWTTPPSAMAEEYVISDDPIVNYKNYYKIGKVHLHKYTKREMPDWL